MSRTKEYSVSEETHKDQLLPLSRAPEESQNVTESIVQKIIKLSRAGAVTSFPREPIPVPNHPWGEKPNPDTQIKTFPGTSSRHFLGVPSLVTPKISDCPSTSTQAEAVAMRSRCSLYYFPAGPYCITFLGSILEAWLLPLTLFPLYPV